MIVTCTNCQAKFRVADEKIGPRGAKVRCSKCQTVFLVRREGAEPAAPAPPPSGLELEPPRPSPAPARAVPPPLPPPLPQPPPLPGTRPPDPFAATMATFPPPADPFAAAAPSDATSPAADAPGPPPDPFAQAADPFGPAPSPDPFAAQPAADPFAQAPPDPFAAPSAAADPFAEPAASSGGADAGDLLGVAASAAPPLAAGDPAPPAAEDDGLALEERAPAPPRPASSAPFDFGGDAGYDAFAAGEAGFGSGALELGSPATAAPQVDAPGDAPGDAPPVLSPAAPAAADGPRPAPRGAPGDTPSEAADAAAGRAPRGERLRSVAINAVALAALLVAAVVILALWRTEGPIDAAALRPAALVSALRGGRGDAPFAPREVRSGLYERERAPPVLFVRGTVVSRAPAAVARVQIRVELVRGGAVVATGEGIAGALPSPEELWSAHDATALAEVARVAARRAPAEIRPGDAVPFLVAIADQPADLSGTSLRVNAAPDGSPAP